MRYWFSPLPLPAALIRQLSQAGLKAWASEHVDAPERPFLLLYDSPDRVIRAAAEAEVPLTTQQLSAGYSQVLTLADTTGQQPLAGWRLEVLGAEALNRWLGGSLPNPAPGSAPVSAPAELAAAMLSLLERLPQVLDRYNDLELRAELLGGEPDLHCRQRLLQALQLEDLMPRLLEMFRTPAAVVDLEAQLQAKEGELREAREEAELTLLQLHQVQEELEHYFLLSRGQDHLLGQYGQQQLQVQNLLAQLTTLRADQPAVPPRP